jgi:CHASE2 domain-containing sensor protein
MTKKAPYIVDISLGVILTALVAWGHNSRSYVTETTSLKTYDAYFKLSRDRFPKLRNVTADTSSVQIVEIDDESIANLGRWPWPRALQAQLIDEVVNAEAKVIGLNIFYSEKDQNEGLEKINEIRDTFSALMETNSL